MPGRVHEEHLLDHQLGDRTDLRQAHGLEFFRSVGALGGKVVQHLQYVHVASYDPGVKESVPVHRILRAQTTKQGVGVGQHLRVQKMIKAQRTGPRASGNSAVGGWAHKSAGWEFKASRRCASSSLMASRLATISRSTAPARSTTVGWSNSVRRGSSTWNASRKRAITWVPNKELPPR